MKIKLLLAALLSLLLVACGGSNDKFEFKPRPVTSSSAAVSSTTAVSSDAAVSSSVQSTTSSGYRQQQFLCA